MRTLSNIILRKESYKPLLTYKCPQKKGVCLKIITRTPKKPNSALRKVAKIRLSNRITVIGYIPGITHTLQEHSTILLKLKEEEYY